MLISTYEEILRTRKDLIFGLDHIPEFLPSEMHIQILFVIKYLNQCNDGPVGQQGAVRNP
jgi:hypothetical protein